MACRRSSVLYSKLPVYISGVVRAGLGVAFDLVAALCMTGYIWAFRESWSVTANQFVLTWMLLWFLMHIHFLIVDAATAFLPLPALPFFLLTWIIINITSSISPFPVNPSFYRWGYALPANEAYTVLTRHLVLWQCAAAVSGHAYPVLLVDLWYRSGNLWSFASLSQSGDAGCES